MSQSTPLESLPLISEDVRVTIHRKPGCQIELHTIAAAPLVRLAHSAAVKKVGKEVELPGFRKGKAPAEWILKKFPQDVEKAFHKELANLVYSAAQKLANIPLLNGNGQISYEFKKESAEEAELYFSFETEPEVPSIEVHSFDPKPITREPILESQIEEAVRQMRFFYADWKTISDRPIQDGDYILISLETLDQEPPQKVFDHIRFEVSKERMAHWMKKLVEGAKQGDVLEGISEPDETASKEDKNILQPKKVRLTIHKVEEALLPELNDEFAKKVGASDVTAMREFVSKILNEKADEKVNEALREQVNDFLTDSYSFDLPRSLVETEKQDRIRQALLNPQSKAKWDAMSLEERQKIEESVFQDANCALRLFYLSRKIVNDAKIPISQKEIQEEAISTLNAIKGDRPIEKIPKEVYALALSKVLLAKAQDYIITQTQKP